MGHVDPPGGDGRFPDLPIALLTPSGVTAAGRSRSRPFETGLRILVSQYVPGPQALEEILEQLYCRLGEVAGHRAANAYLLALTLAREVTVEWLRSHGRDRGTCAAANDEARWQYPEEDELACLATVGHYLSPVVRRAFTLRKIYGYSDQRIAAALHLSEEEVQAALVQAALECGAALWGVEPKVVVEAGELS